MAWGWTKALLAAAALTLPGASVMAQPAYSIESVGNAPGGPPSEIPPTELESFSALGVQELSDTRPTFERFKSLCLAHRADPAGALAQAETDGWRGPSGPVPGAYLPAEFGASQLRAGLFNGRAEVLVVGPGRLELWLEKMDLSLCGMMLGQVGHQAFLSDVETWLGMEPIEEYPGGGAVYVFVETPQGPKTINPNAFGRDLSRAMRTGKVSLVIVTEGANSGDLAFVSYGAITRATAL